MKLKIIYTKTDEAPLLATASLLPVLRAFGKTAGINFELKDISLAGRILALFPEYLEEEQRVSDNLAELGKLVDKAEANIIKLPNISASASQLQGAVRELQEKGFGIPDYPEDPGTDKERALKERYDCIKGSAVNPVLREGNSDRRAPAAVKKYAMNHPHAMGPWSKDSKTRVASMSAGDFYGTEQSVIISSQTSVHVELVDSSGKITILKESFPLERGEILDSAVLSVNLLREFIKEQISYAKREGLLFSVHLKATMMKVSDPIIFGHVVSLYFEDLFTRFRDTFDQLGVDPANGIGDLLTKIEKLAQEEKKSILEAIDVCYQKQPDLAMVNSDRGITNLHVSSDIIIDASMPAAIRSSGKMWGPDGTLRDMAAIIPDRSYAGIYEETINFCRENGAFDPATMGSVSNVGLMAQKAEEYGSHDKTFEIPGDGVVRVVDSNGTHVMEQKVEKGDIFRMCQVKDAPIRDWVRLAVQRAKKTSQPAIFWLDENRAHDRNIIKKVNVYLKLHNIDGLSLEIMSPKEATRTSLQRAKEGKDTISVTGNVLRDYLTDLFPILELGTSAKMLSIVPLMNGGGLFETGAGGSAPKHVQQFLEEGHLRWDSLGEFLALAASLEHLGNTFHNEKALILAETLNTATEMFLENNRSPSRKVNEIDNRGSHFYLTLYWAQALAEQNRDTDLKAAFTPLAESLLSNEKEIITDLENAQGHPVDIGGYYYPDPVLLTTTMRPSNIFNGILESFLLGM